MLNKYCNVNGQDVFPVTSSGYLTRNKKVVSDSEPKIHCNNKSQLLKRLNVEDSLSSPSSSKKSRQDLVLKLLEEICEISEELSTSDDKLDTLTELFLSLYSFGSEISKSEVGNFSKLMSRIVDELVKNEQLLQNFQSEFHLIYGVGCVSPPSLRCKIRSGIEFLLQYFPDTRLNDIFKKLLERVDQIFNDGILRKEDELEVKPHHLPKEHNWWNTPISRVFRNVTQA